MRDASKAGGHALAEADVMRRFGRSLHLLETVYKPAVDDWLVYDSRDGSYALSDWNADAKNT
jgi:predicted ABC-type ATPase